MGVANNIRVILTQALSAAYSAGMEIDEIATVTAFDGHSRFAAGKPADVADAVRSLLRRTPGAAVLMFDDATGAVIDLDLREDGHPEATAGDRKVNVAVPPAPPCAEPPRGRGRPKLGVVAREVTLLPRQWDWLSAQPGGASQALRRLVDEARRRDAGRTAGRQARDAAYRFMSALAGDFPGFEEAARALFADDRERFRSHAAAWPPDVSAHAEQLAWGRAGEAGDARAV